jgi:hypothetical protein
MDSTKRRKERMGHIVSHFSSGIKLIVICLFILLLIGQSGCATPKPYALPPPLSEEVRENIGTVGVASACFLPKAEIQKPMGKGSGAAAGAGQGALAVVNGGAMSADPLGLLIGIALAPVGAAIGGVVGVVEGVPSPQIKEAENSINKAISEVNIQAAMREYVLRVARQQTGYHFTLLDSDGPKTPETKVDYTFLRKEGIDTVLEITVHVFGLSGLKGINPPLAFFMTLQTRVVRTLDGAVLYEQKLEYRSARRTFTNWAANDAKLFRAEFDRCYESLAEKVVEEIFCVYDLPLNPTPHG